MQTQRHSRKFQDECSGIRQNSFLLPLLDQLLLNDVPFSDRNVQVTVGHESCHPKISIAFNSVSLLVHSVKIRKAMRAVFAQGQFPNVVDQIDFQITI